MFIYFLGEMAKPCISRPSLSRPHFCIITEIMDFYSTPKNRILPWKNLGHAAVGDTELAGNIARADSVVRQLDNPLSNHIWEWPSINEHTSQLVHAPVAWKK